MNTDPASTASSTPPSNSIFSKLTMPVFLGGCAVFAVIAVLIVAIFGFTLLSWTNQASSLQNQYDMKVKDNSSEFDNMWKKIKQTAEVPEAKKNAFKEIFSAYADARSGNGGGSLATLVKEQVPNLDLNIYDKLMNIITGSRDTWTMRQKELVSIAEQHNHLVVTNPSGFFLKLFGYKLIDPKVITSERTEETFRTGKDDDVTLFPKAPAAAAPATK